MAAASIRSLILDQVETELEKIDGAGDYNNDVVNNGGVQRFEQNGNDFAVVPGLVFHWPSDVRIFEEVSTGGFDGREITLVVMIFSESAGVTSSAEQMETLIADVERALMQDPQFTNRATSTELVDSVPFPAVEDMPQIGGIVTARIRYAVGEADPALQG